MSRKQLELAAKVWALAAIAHTDLCADTETANKVRKLAAARAQTKLRNLGTCRSEIMDEYDAIEFAERTHPTPEQRQKGL